MKSSLINRNPVLPKNAQPTESKLSNHSLLRVQLLLSFLYSIFAYWIYDEKSHAQGTLLIQYDSSCHGVQRMMRSPMFGVFLAHSLLEFWASRGSFFNKLIPFFTFSNLLWLEPILLCICKRSLSLCQYGISLQRITTLQQYDERPLLFHCLIKL